MSEALQCECAGAGSLGVLGDVAAAYHQRLALLARAAPGDRLQKHVEVLQSWVKDLSEQNALLARTVEELETEFTSRLLLERRRHSEIASELRAESSVLRRALWRKDEDVRGLLEVLRRLREFDHCSIDGIHFHEWDKSKKICDKVNEMKMLNDSLIKENLSKDREIRKLNKDMQHCEQTVTALRNELSNSNYHTSEVSKKDAEVTADICCSGSQECGDAEPVRDGALCCARLQRMDVSVKSSGDSVRSLRQLNVSLSEEVRALQRVCGALDEQCRAAALRARFKDDVIHEMRRQLRQAKSKLKELSESNIPKSQKEHDVGHKRASYDSLTIACVQRPRRAHARELTLDCDCRGSVYDESDDDLAIVTSTPNTTSNIDRVCLNTRGGSFIVRSPPPSPELSDGTQHPRAERVVPIEGLLTNSHLDGNIKPESKIIDEYFQESTGASGSEGEARARSLEDSLLAAARALKNKEETVRVQAQSLALAEERLAAASRTRSGRAGCQVDMADISATSQLQDNREIVKTLQDNLSVIQELYRECFYEAARQDEVIAVLRALCRGATPGPGVALQVENLKSEISNFLNNSSSNDSGVWEVGELRGVEEQLQRLWAVLQDNCTCGMMEENMKLKKTTETMEIQILDLRHRVSDLQEALENKDNLDQRYQRQIKEKDEELQHIKDQLSDLERDSRDQGTECDTLACEIKQLEGILTDKSQELVNVQQQCVSQETIITQLREELEKSNSNAKESFVQNASLRCEVRSLTAQVAAWRRQLEADSRPRADEHRRQLAQHYAEKCTQADQLRSSLAAARAGGAALCARARAALHAARDGLRALADHARENEEIIGQQELLIRSLREKTSKNVSRRSSASDVDPCCSKYLHRVEMRSGNRRFASVGETPRSGRTSSGSRARTAESETHDGPPHPAPPRRLLRKKPLCVDRRCQWPQLREASVCCTSESPGSYNINREFSADSLLERVERTHEALELAHRRWCRQEHRHDLPTA